ncbi:MAG: hypothetical protein AAF692_08095 [Pseudomonadota bacterium]
MKTAPFLTVAALAGLSLAACSGDTPETSPAGAVSEGEAAALDEAAKMLDEQRLPEGVLPDLDAPPVQPTPQTAPENPQD